MPVVPNTPIFVLKCEKKPFRTYFWHLATYSARGIFLCYTIDTKQNRKVLGGADDETTLEPKKCQSRNNRLPVYDVRWAMDLVRKIGNCECRDEIISALEFMGKFERYNPMGGNELKCDAFMAWNIEGLRWQGDYRSGHIGSYAWDIAAVINQANDPEFSDVFLESYMRHSGREPTLALLQSNLYYVQVAEAARSNDFEMAVRTAREITGRHMFKTEMISGETISRLGISGWRNPRCRCKKI